jgi:NagD protein
MKNIICDIDGVLMHNNKLIPGADKFINRIVEQGNRFLLLTNYPSQTPRDLQNRLSSAGIEVSDERFYTSATATAAFLEKQAGRKAYVVGEGALTHALYHIGFTITDINPDYVIVGETRAYNWDMIQKASYFIMKGARFIATNPDVAGPGGHPACGALCAPIERITRKQPFYIGKPSPWIMRAALNAMDVHSEDTIIIGDNMNTDILAGIQAGMETVLVLTGVSQVADLDDHPYRPNHIFPNVGEVDIV